MAGNTVTIHVEGLEGLEAKLYELPTKLSKLYLGCAIRAGARVFRDEIRQTAPRLTGWLQSQVAFTTKLSSRNDTGEAHVGVRKRQNPAEAGRHPATAANEAYWYEFGTVHQPARPFIRPAFDAKKDAALEAFAGTLRQGLAEVFK